MEILRVFQGGVLPADLRVILVATKAIKAGDELTFNYGDDYVAEHLDKRKIEDIEDERLKTRVLRSQAKKQCTQ
ncbi:unnamed protein product [Caenorhabditis brenneri]